MPTGKAIPLLQFFVGASMVSYVEFVLLLFVPHLSFVWCLGKVVIHGPGSSRVSSIIKFKTQRAELLFISKYRQVLYVLIRVCCR